MTSSWSKMVIATYNAFLHEECSMCPGNHEVQYFKGYLYLDNDLREKWLTDKIREKARVYQQAGYEPVYSGLFNTWLLHYRGE